MTGMGDFIVNAKIITFTICLRHFRKNLEIVLALGLDEC
jgi:hypothetical protein